MRIPENSRKLADLFGTDPDHEEKIRRILAKAKAIKKKAMVSLAAHSSRLQPEYSMTQLSEKRLFDPILPDVQSNLVNALASGNPDIFRIGYDLGFISLRYRVFESDTETSFYNFNIDGELASVDQLDLSSQEKEILLKAGRIEASLETLVDHQREETKAYIIVIISRKY